MIHISYYQEKNKISKESFRNKIFKNLKLEGDAEFDRDFGKILEGISMDLDSAKKRNNEKNIDNIYDFGKDLMKELKNITNLQLEEKYKTGVFLDDLYGSNHQSFNNPTEFLKKIIIHCMDNNVKFNKDLETKSINILQNNFLRNDISNNKIKNKRN